MHYVDMAHERLMSYFNRTLRYRSIGTPVYEPTGKEKVSQIPDEWKTEALLI
jgi:adenine-specific DNA-methyltransferase